jgi:hypothetical protein
MNLTPGPGNLTVWFIVGYFAFRSMHPVFRALAVILVARFVDAKLAKSAIPMILTPWSIHAFRLWKDRGENSIPPVGMMDDE